MILVTHKELTSAGYTREDVILLSGGQIMLSRRRRKKVYMSNRYRVSLWTDQGPNSFELTGTEAEADERINQIWADAYGSGLLALDGRSAYEVLQDIEAKRQDMIESEDSIKNFLFQNGAWADTGRMIRFSAALRDACRDFPGALVRVEAQP